MRNEILGGMIFLALALGFTVTMLRGIDSQAARQAQVAHVQR